MTKAPRKKARPANPARVDTTVFADVPVARLDRGQRPHYFERIGSGDGTSIKLDQPRLIVGRAKDSDIVIASEGASRHHAVLTRFGADYSIRDNDSRNGVFLNGLKIHSALLRDGDVVQIAEVMFAYHES